MGVIIKEMAVSTMRTDGPPREQGSASAHAMFTIQGKRSPAKNTERAAGEVGGESGVVSGGQGKSSLRRSKF